MKDSLLREKSKGFALCIINMYKYLCNDKKEHVISKQVLRSGTSIGSNIAEAFYAQSDLDFIHKLHIPLKKPGKRCTGLNFFKNHPISEKKRQNQ